MTLWVLSLAILLLAATQPSRERMVAAMPYATVNIAFLAIPSSWVTGDYYFISAAAADVIIMWLIVQPERISGLGVDLLRLCLVEIGVNALGWVMWYNYKDPFAYVTLYKAVQIWVMVLLIRRGRADDTGGYAMGHWRDFLLVITSSRHNTI